MQADVQLLYVKHPTRKPTTMIYRIKEKMWSWGEEFSITDEAGNECFFVKSKAFSWGNQLSFQDKDRTELALIKQKVMSWKQTYHIIIGDEHFADIVKEWSWFKKKFTLDVPGPNDYTIEGSFWQHEFLFERGGRQVATVSKELWAWTDSYGVNVADDEDHLAILCTCIVIDQVLDDEQSG